MFGDTGREDNGLGGGRGEARPWPGLLADTPPVWVLAAAGNGGLLAPKSSGVTKKGFHAQSRGGDKDRGPVMRPRARPFPNLHIGDLNATLVPKCELASLCFWKSWELSVPAEERE